VGGSPCCADPSCAVLRRSSPAGAVSLTALAASADGCCFCVVLAVSYCQSRRLCDAFVRPASSLRLPCSVPARAALLRPSDTGFPSNPRGVPSFSRRLPPAFPAAKQRRSRGIQMSGLQMSSAHAVRASQFEPSQDGRSHDLKPSSHSSIQDSMTQESTHAASRPRPS